MNDAERLDRVRLAAKVIAPLAARIEADRRLPAEAVGALVDAGVFKLLVPHEYGGAEASSTLFLDAIETIARVDGSAGWCAMIGASSGIMSGFLAADVAREVYGPADAISCGAFAPTGRAVPVEGGWRVSGRWAFASGCEHSEWRMGGVLVEGSAPEVRSALFRADETYVLDTWDTSGLRGSGSHDFEVNDVFVPAARQIALFGRPTHAAPLYATPFFGLLAAGVASVAVGIARGALDGFVEVAKAKVPLGARRSIANRELVQLAVARAEGNVLAARAALRIAFQQLDADVAAGGVSPLETRARVRIAAAHAATAAAAAVDLVYEAAGAGAVYSKSPLQRHFRDVHVATQHAMVSSTSEILAGRVLLGLESDTSTL
jgi:alkylation response protein AidB-like acyl-CoA dehydrogenase